MDFIFSAIHGVFSLIMFIIWALLMIYTVLDILRNRNLTTGIKLLWFVVIWVAPFLGSLLYLFWGRNQRFS